ncbi:MAG: histidine--tRNA ligase, partial [Desulfobulbaceae bacterium]|nr:histidine--tRNA ligase [Desulfobulbaceae bacterium]
MKIKAINGFKDTLPEEIGIWRTIETTCRDIFARHAFREIRLPILEQTELFARSIGEATDIVEKEMYTFTDKQITMRPEATASLLRSFIEHGLHVSRPIQKLFTIGPMFRHERPQKGRLRQFHQIDAEVIGGSEAQIDAELMAMGQMMLNELGLDASLEINSLGCRECRPSFRVALVAFLEKRRGELCEDCQRRTTTNPLRVLDCKKTTCRALVTDAPSILEHLCSECNQHFEQVKYYLNLFSVRYTINNFMVRGLDYYCRTTFEFLTNDLGAQSAIGAGGRYDGLIENLGGPPLPAVGFAVGIERLVLLLQSKQDAPEPEVESDIFIAALGERAADAGAQLCNALRRKGGHCGIDYSNRSLKAQMKLANRSNARLVLIIGDQELDKGEAILRDMQTQEQDSLPLGSDLEKNCADLLKLL